MISNIHLNLQVGSQNEGDKNGLANDKEEEEVVRCDAQSAFTKQLNAQGSDLNLYNIDTLLIRDSSSSANIGSVAANKEGKTMSGQCLDDSTGNGDVTNCSPG